MLRPLKWLTIDYSPRPEERSFLQRAQRRREGRVEITVAVPSDQESAGIFGVRLARHGLQAVWLEVVNNGEKPLWLDRVQVDPNYFTPLEAANLVHFTMGKRLLAFGLLGWLYLPLLPLLPLKLWGLRSANRELKELFRGAGFPGGIIPAAKSVNGFLFTSLDEAVKRIDIRLLGRGQALNFPFMVEVPGLKVSHPPTENAPDSKAEELDETAFQAWLERQPRATGNARGTVEGDPLNLVIVGARASIVECLKTWDETESLTVGTAWKTAKAFLLESQYRYSPVSPLYLGGRQQELALCGQPVWIVQVSRDIGVRFTLKTWNLTTHQIDPDVDEARNYVLDNLLVGGHVARLGFVPGVEAAPATLPRRNLTGDPYFTDVLRAVAMLSAEPTSPSSLSWSIGTPRG